MCYFCVLLGGVDIREEGLDMIIRLIGYMKGCRGEGFGSVWVGVVGILVGWRGWRYGG
jgi:hypothetical protein